MTFMEKLKHASQVNRSLICVGLDPERSKLPECVREKEHALFEFNRAIIDATVDWVCAYKPQAAYYAGQNADEDLKLTIDYIHERAPQIPVILDVKRSDIGSTATMYAKEAFERYKADATRVSSSSAALRIRILVICRTSSVTGRWFMSTLRCSPATNGTTTTTPRS